MQSAFESWVGQHVLVRLTLGKTKVSLRGILLKDLMETLLMGPEFGSELACAIQLYTTDGKFSSVSLHREYEFADGYRMDKRLQILSCRQGSKIAALRGLTDKAANNSHLDSWRVEGSASE